MNKTVCDRCGKECLTPFNETHEIPILVKKSYGVITTTFRDLCQDCKKELVEVNKAFWGKENGKNAL